MWKRMLNRLVDVLAIGGAWFAAIIPLIGMVESNVSNRAEEATIFFALGRLCLFLAMTVYGPLRLIPVLLTVFRETEFRRDLSITLMTAQEYLAWRMKKPILLATAPVWSTIPLEVLLLVLAAVDNPDTFQLFALCWLNEAACLLIYTVFAFLAARAAANRRKAAVFIVLLAIAWAAACYGLFIGSFYTGALMFNDGVTGALVAATALVAAILAAGGLSIWSFRFSARAMYKPEDEE